ncbi:hypothetical protein GJ496_004579 [Pomphorhynchus laevis]|nr:hypothetical protein GJ496_004579 [Pomphorhynchus laevis]
MIINRTTQQILPVSHSEPNFMFHDMNFSDAQSFRDRSAEFGDITELIKNRTNKSNAEIKTNDCNESEFEIASIKIAENLSLTKRKLEKLTLLITRSFTLENRSNEIQQLIDIIRQDTTHLNYQIMELQKLNVLNMNSKRFANKSERNHSKAIVLGLQSELANVSSAFKSILESRNSSVEQQEERRSKISGRSRYNNEQLRKSHNSFLVKQDEMHRLRDSSIDSQDTVINVNQMQSNQLAYKDTFLQERTDAMQNVEETIVQLGEIFQQLAVMVHEQGEMVQRIDANIEEVHFNLESATFELKKYFRAISSNRWLMIKIFAIFI